MPPPNPAGVLRSRRMLGILGAVLVIGGAASILFPFLASLLVTGYAAVAFAIGGAIQVVLALGPRERDTLGGVAGAAAGALMVLFAILLAFDPLAGLVSLTVLAAVIFLGLGALRIAVAIRRRPGAGWTWQAVSGGISLVLGLVILIALPRSAGTTLGILLGVELIFAGAAAIALATRPG